MERFWNKVNKTETCWLWTGARFTLYGQIRVDRRNVAAHRFSWTLHFGPIPVGMCVCHHCDTPLCVRPDHLFLGTTKDNVRDKINKGRDVCIGERNYGAKLTENDVVKIRQEHALGVRRRHILAKYGIKQTQYYRIINGVSWSHI